MNHLPVISGRNKTQKARDHRLQNISTCILIVIAISIMILNGVGSAQAVGPTATATTATDITATSVQLSGVVYPNGFNTVWEFLYYPPGALFPTGGRSTIACGSPLGSVWVSGSASQQTVGCQLTGLQPSTNYRFTLAVQWRMMTPVIYGGMVPFTTLSSPSPSATLSLTPTSGPPGTVVTLSGSGFPPGMTLAYCLSTSTSRCQGFGAQAPVFTVDPSGNIPSGATTPTVTIPVTAPGTYYILILSAPGAVIASAPFTVTSPSTPPPTPGSCGFMLSVAPVSQTVVQGGTAVFGLSMSASNPACAGLSMNLSNMDVTGLDPSMSWQLTPSGQGIAITTSPMTPSGAYALSLIFSVNGVQQQQPFTLIVTPAPTPTPTPPITPFTYSISVYPSSQSVPIGGSTSYVVSVLPVSGTPVPVSLTVMGLPASVSSSFTIPSGTPPYTSTLNLDLSSSTANPGAYAITVLGNAAGNAQSAPATLNIRQAQTTTTTPPVSSPGPRFSLIVIVALVALVVVLGVLFMRGRGRQATTTTSTQQATTPQQTTTPPTFCGNCGKQNPASNMFCSRCGNKLETS